MKSNIVLIILFFVCYGVLISSDECGNIINCDADKKYPYKYCNSTTGRVESRCVDGKSNLNDAFFGYELMKRMLPICYYNDGYYSSQDLENIYLANQKVFSVKDAKEELNDACRVWNCVCGVQDRECRDEINCVFGRNGHFFGNTGIYVLGMVSWGSNIIHMGQSINKGDSFLLPSTNCPGPGAVKIYFNVSKELKYGKWYPDEDYDEEVQFFINEKYIADEVLDEIYSQGKRAYSFLYVAVHEIGHFLGMGHYNDCDDNSSGVMNNIAPEAHGKFSGLSNDDKCMFMRLYYPGLIGIYEYHPQAQKVYPNPGRHIVAIDFELHKHTENLKMSIMNPLGEVVLVPIESEAYQEGEHSVLINVDILPVGVYYIIIEAGMYRTAQPLTIVR